MRKLLLITSATLSILNSNSVFASSETDLLKQQLKSIKNDYEQRIQLLEAKLEIIEQKTKQVDTKMQQVSDEVEQNHQAIKPTSSQSAFNPAISLILDGQYASSRNNPDNYQLPGFMLGPEAGLNSKGFNLGESELTLASNIDDKFYGQVTLAFGGDPDGTEVEVEEAYFQTLGLGNGLTLKGGRFFSGIGYLNGQHAHAWDFADAPLVYQGLFGGQLKTDGLQGTYLLPTDLFMQLGLEFSNGRHFPAAGSKKGNDAWSLFYNVGGDIGIEHSWQLGLSHWQANKIAQRTSSFLGTDTLFKGNSKVNGLDFVYKWAPNGNPTYKNFKLQFEYFDQKEDGLLTVNNSSSYDGDRHGWYAQGIYQFMPQWKLGLRYDQLGSDNHGSNVAVLNNAGFDNSYSPKRYSAMIEWLPSEFSRIRLQYNQDKSYRNTDQQIFVQYTYSLGTHGAHSY